MRLLKAEIVFPNEMSQAFCMEAVYLANTPWRLKSMYTYAWRAVLWVGHTPVWSNALGNKRETFIQVGWELDSTGSQGTMIQHFWQRKSTFSGKKPIIFFLIANVDILEMTLCQKTIQMENSGSAWVARYVPHPTPVETPSFEEDLCLLHFCLAATKLCPSFPRFIPSSTPPNNPTVRFSNGWHPTSHQDQKSTFFFPQRIIISCTSLKKLSSSLKHKHIKYKSIRRAIWIKPMVHLAQ